MFPRAAALRLVLILLVVCSVPFATQAQTCTPPPAPTIETAQPHCPGEQVQATLRPLEAYTGALWTIEGGVFHTWNGGTSTTTTGEPATWSATSFAPVTLRVIASGFDGCDSPEATRQIVVAATAPVIVAPATLCASSPGTADLEPSPTGVPWLNAAWTITGGHFLDPFTNQPVTEASGLPITFYPDGSGDVTLTALATDAEYCIPPSASATVAIAGTTVPVINAESEICPDSNHFAALEAPASGSWEYATWTITGGYFLPYSSTTTYGTNVEYYSDGSGPVTLAVTANHSDGCTTSEVTRTVALREIPAPVISAETEICPDSTHFAAIEAPATGEWQYATWTITGGYFLPYSSTTTYGTNVEYYSDGSGPITLSVTAQDSFGCTTPMATRTVALREIPAPLINAETEICPDSNHFAAIEAPATGEWQYATWTITGGYFLPYSSTSAYGTNVEYYSDGSGPITLSVTAQDSFGCTTPMATRTVALREIPAPLINAETEICPDSTHFAAIEAPASGSWQYATWTITGGYFLPYSSTSTYGTNVEYYSDGSGPVTLTVIAQDSFGCTTPMATRTVALRAIPAPLINAETEICPSSNHFAAIEAPAAGSWQHASWTITGGYFLPFSSTSAYGTNVQYYSDGSGPITLSVIAQDSFGCTTPMATRTVALREVPAPIINAEAEICPGSDHYATIEAPANGSWQNVSWTITGGRFRDGMGVESTSASTPSVTYFADGSGPVTLTVIAQDSFGCTTPPASRTIALRTLPPAVVEADNTTCPGSERIATIAAPASGSWSAVQWSITGGRFRNALGEETTTASGTAVTYVANQSIDMVELTVTATDASGCSTYGNKGVAVGAGNPAIYVSSQTACPGSSGNAVVTVPARGEWQSVVWEITNGTGTPNGNSFAYTVGTSGITTITATGTDPFGCVGTRSIDIAIDAPAATITASGPTHLCANGSVTLTANENGTYAWSNGATTKSITVSQAGSYFVTVTNANGCSATSTPVSVTQEGPVSVSIQHTHVWGPLCEGMTDTLTANPSGEGYTYLWSTGETTRSITVSTSGNYTVTVTSPGGCSNSLTIQESFQTAPKPTLVPDGPTSYCDELRIQADYYAWNVDRIWWEHTPGSGGYAIGSTYVAYGNGTAWFNVRYTTGCVRTSDPITYNKLNGPNAWAYDTRTLCNNEPLTLEVFGEPNMTVTWNHGPTGRTTVVTAPGTYTWNATGGADNCTMSGSIVVAEHTPGPATVTASGATTFCEGGSVTLTADQTSSSYQWSNGATTRAITVSDSGAYAVSVYDAQGCLVTSQPVLVTENATPTATVSGTQSVCAGATATISAALTGTGPWNLTWSDGFVQNGVTSSPATRSVSPSANTSYSVTAVSDAYCTGTASGTATVTVNPNPAPGIRASQTYSETGFGSVTQHGENVDVCGNPTVRLIPQALDPSFTYSWSTGATTAILDVTASGTYTVTVTAPSGCATTSTVNVVFTPYPARPVVTASGTQLCDAGGSITLTAPAASGWQWSNGATTQSIVVTEPGTYTVRTRNGSCESISSEPIDVTRGRSTVTADGWTALCENGSVTLTANDGTSWLWSNGATTRSITVTAPGTFTVTTTNGACAYEPSQPVTVTQRTPVIEAGGPTSFCVGQSVTLTASDGLAWLWSNGATSRSITVYESGTYDVQVSFGDGCSMRTAPVVVEARQITTTIAADTTAICAGGSISLTSSVTGGNDYTYQWYDNTYQPIAGATSPALTHTPSTSGFVYLVATDELGCPDTSNPIVYRVEPVIDATITAPSAFCPGTTGTASVPDAGPDAMYAWSATNGTVLFPGLREVMFTANGSEPVTLTVTITNPGCSATSSKTVAVYPAPDASVTPSGPTTFCQGGEVTLTAPAGMTYQWNTGATSRELVVSTSGSYSVTVTDANGCAATSAPVNVTVNPMPSATITPSGATTFCEGGSVTLSAPAGATSYLWSTGETTPSITVNDSGTYTVTTTLGSCSATDDISVTVNPTPSATITPSGATTFCEGGSVTLAAPAGATSYLWSTGETTPSITVNDSGTYTVTATLGSCSATDDISVTVNAVPSATITPSGATTFCQGGEVTLTAPAGATSYLWSTGETTPSITVNDSGTYTVTATLGSCSATDDIAVTVNPVPSATITPSGATTFCEGGEVTLTAPAGATSYLWSTGETTPSITVNATGTYSVTATLGSCSATDDITVNVNAVPSATITPSGATTFCQGGEVTLTAPAGATSYLWSTGETTPSITVNATGTYSVTTTLGSCSATDDISVTVNAVPSATITPSGATTFCEGGEVTLTAPAGATSYLWSTGETTPSITVNDSGTYTVTTTLGSCSATDDISVNVNAVPSATITPSGATTFCQGGEVTLTAPAGATSYLWSTGETTPSITVNDSGTYTVTTTLGACSATDDITVTVNAVPSATITPSGATTFCQGGEVTLTAPAGATSYLWSTGETTPSITVNATGTYTVTATLGSCSATDDISVTVNPLPPATITANGATPFCQGNSVRLSAPEGAYTYLWSNGETSREIVVNAGGAYHVTVGNGTCSAQSPSTVVTVNPVPDATITPESATTFCNGGQVRLNAPAGATSYQWSTGETSPSIVASASGTYTVTTTLGSCSATGSITVTELDPTVITGEPQNVTMPRNVTRTLTVTATGAAPLTYQWYRGSSGVTTNPIAGETSSTLSISSSKKGTFTYWVRVRSATCTSSFDDSRTVTVTVN